MKVWVLVENDIEDYYVRGVFQTRDAAIGAAERFARHWLGDEKFASFEKILSPEDIPASSRLLERATVSYEFKSALEEWSYRVTDHRAYSGVDFSVYLFCVDA